MNTDKHGWMTYGASRSQDDPFNLNLGGTEVDEESNLQIRRAEIVQALSHVDIFERPGSLQFNDNFIVNENIGEEFTNDDIVVFHA